MDGVEPSSRMDEVFGDYKGRRSGLVTALTTEADMFYRHCDPAKDNLCLYGLPNGQWEINLPAEEVPTDLPEPTVGINFARDSMEPKFWLALVAVHCDAWLLAVAFYLAARFNFRKADRKRLFSLINELPTVFEVVTGKSKAKKSYTINSSNKPKKSRVQQAPEFRAKNSKVMLQPKPEEVFDNEEEEEHGESLCGECGMNYDADEFWICCDICEIWYHGRCVKVTPAMAENIKRYKCPYCNNKKGQRPE